MTQKYQFNPMRTDKNFKTDIQPLIRRCFSQDLIWDYGCDSLYLYLLTCDPGRFRPEEDGALTGIFRFLSRFYARSFELWEEDNLRDSETESFRSHFLSAMEYYERQQNFAHMLAEFMKTGNYMKKCCGAFSSGFDRDFLLEILKLLYPYAPGISSELYSVFTGKNISQLRLEEWPLQQADQEP